MGRTLTHDTGLGVGGHPQHGSSLPLLGNERHPDSVEATLQPTHLTGGFGVALAGLIRRTDDLMELSLVIQGRQQ
jgi:hypothetical protein